MTIKLAPPKGSHQPRTLPPRAATYKARGNNPPAQQLRSQYQQALLQKIQDHAPHQTWDDIAILLTQTAEETFGTSQPQRGKPWFAGRQHEIQRIHQQVSTAKQHLTQCTQAARAQAHNQDLHNQMQQAKRQLQSVKRQKRRLFTQWERQYWNTVAQQAETAEEQGDTYVLYSLMSKLKIRKANNTKSSMKRITRNPFAEAESWKDHFSNIQNGAVPVADRVWDHIPQNPNPATWLCETPTIPELTRALAKMKIGKAPGDDGVTVEMLKWAPQAILDNLFSYTQSLWNTTCTAPPDLATAHWPQSWLQATVIPLWKQKHPRSNKSNWRGVTLLSIGGKLISRIVASRLQQFSESFMDEEQQGFRRNRGVDDVLQVSRRIAEEVCSSRGQDTIKLTLYDIEKAYPRINREALWTLLHKRGAPAPFIQVCQALHNHTQFHVKLEGTLSQNYEADRGLKEGCPSSPPLFNLYHQAVLHDFRARRKRSAESAGLTPGIEWKVFVDGRLTRRRTYYQTQANSKVHIFGDLEFADDTATIATASEFPLADQLLEQTFTDWGEKLNRAKTETLLLKPGTPPEQRRDPPQQHHSVRHVGGILSDTGSQWKDTLQRCAQARRRIKEIAKAWSTGTDRGRGQTSRVGILARLRVMRSIILPTLTSFGRTRTWTKAQIAALQTVQNYALQRVFGLDRLALHELHITNEQLHKAALWPPIRTVLMRQTMRWLGHVCRMPLHPGHAFV